MSGRVTGIGGILFTCEHPDQVLAWYESALGLTPDASGRVWFQWLELDGETRACSVVSPSADSSDYFVPGTQPFMVSYRVDDLDALLARLRDAGETVIDTGYESERGRFAWVMDPDGQKVELWEPTEQPAPRTAPPGEVTGIGGIFFKSDDRDALKEWYRSRLGIEPDDAGYVVFSWRTDEGPRAYLSWEVFPSDTDYLDPSRLPYMINFRVRDLEALRARLLEDDSVWVDPNVEEYEYGKFGWILDPAGARIELWEPNDRAFD